MKTKYDYAVIVPIFQAEHTLDALVHNLCAFFEKKQASFQLILVDDQSIDKSWEKITHICEQKNAPILAIKLAKNIGQHGATWVGIAHANAHYCITIDEDLQMPVDQIEILISHARQYNMQLVYGVFPKKKHHFVRNFASFLVQLAFLPYLQKAANLSAFRLFDEQLAAKIVKKGCKKTYLDILLLKQTKSVASVRVNHHERKQGKSGYTLKKLILMFGRLIFPLYPWLGAVFLLGFVFFYMHIPAVHLLSTTFYSLAAAFCLGTFFFSMYIFSQSKKSIKYHISTQINVLND